MSAHPQSSRTNRLRARRGFVLMAALWLLVALAAVGLDAALRHKSRRLAAANLLDETKLQNASFAGAEYARSRLTSAMLGRADELRAQASRATAGANRAQAGGATRGRAGTQSMSNMFRTSDPGADPWRDPSGLVPGELDWNGITMQLHLRDVGAALNINGADEVMLQQFFSLGLRLDYALANELAAAILDWRDDDDLPRINGGERDLYVHDGLAMLPANHQFTNIDELRFVRGMTDEIFAQARPYLRISTTTTINVNSAPEPVLLAIPGMNPEGAAALIRMRRSGTFPRSRTEVNALLPSSTLRSLQAAGEQFNRRVIYATDQVEVIAEASVPGTPVHASTQIIVDRALNGAVITWRRVE
jgi:type II secretory pathway component PulK